MKYLFALIIFLCFFVNAFSQNCNKWAKIDSTFWMQAGNLNVSGNQITVEAMFDKTRSNSGSHLYAGDLVSKHLDSSRASYAIRPNIAEITTENGNFVTPGVCYADLNKTYHVALVYDGKELRFYRNGFLMSEVACTGNISPGSYLTDIGYFSKKNGNTNSNFLGYINEVRIWNVARSQDDIRKYMNKSLPDPTSQTGLLAYYIFDDLKNKQGDSRWDATVIGTTKINQTNPQCNFIADSCEKLICFVKAGFRHEQIACDPTMVQFTDTSSNADSLLWNFGNGMTDTSHNPIINYNTYNQYNVQLIAKTNTGCADTTTSTINVALQKDDAITTNNTTICAGDAVQLSAVNGLKYCWSPSTFLSDSSVQNPVAKPTSTIKYYLHVLKPDGSTVTQDSVVISVLPVPVVHANNDTTVCGTASVQLMATGASSYIWMPSTNLNNANVSNPVAAPTLTTNYVVKGIALNGCVATDSVNIFVNPLPQFSLSPTDTSICYGDAALLTANGGDSYNWSPADGLSNTTSSTVTAMPANNTKYDVTITNSVCKLSQVLSANIIVNALSDVTVSKSNDVDCINYQSQLNASGGLTYTWSPSTNISDINISNPVVDPLTNTWYVVTVIGNDGCKNKDSVLVLSTMANSNAVKFEVANAFTPNNDGLNDCFSVKYWGEAESFEMLIYNRWGQVVFHSNKISECWNGNYNGQPQSPGTYIYKITAITKCSNGAVRKTGTLRLLR